MTPSTGSALDFFSGKVDCHPSPTLAAPFSRLSREHSPWLRAVVALVEWLEPTQRTSSGDLRAIAGQTSQSREVVESQTGSARRRVGRDLVVADAFAFLTRSNAAPDTLDPTSTQRGGQAEGRAPTGCMSRECCSHVPERCPPAGASRAEQDAAVFPDCFPDPPPSSARVLCLLEEGPSLRTMAAVTASVATGVYRPPQATGSFTASPTTSTGVNYGTSTSQPGNTDVFLYYFTVPYLDAHVLSVPSWRYAYIVSTAPVRGRLR